MSNKRWRYCSADTNECYKTIIFSVKDHILSWVLICNHFHMTIASEKKYPFMKYLGFSFQPYQFLTTNCYNSIKI